MTNSTRSSSWLTRFICAFIGLLGKIPQSLISLGARIFPAAVFWRSGQTKVEDFHVTENAIDLFRDEYALPLIDPALAAKIAAFSEHFFSGSAGDRISQPLCRIGAPHHDRGHRNFRLSRCLAGAWDLGYLFLGCDCPRPRRFFARSFLGAPLAARPRSALATPSAVGQYPLQK